MVDHEGRRLMVKHLGVDQGDDLCDVFVSVVDVRYLDLLAVDEQPEMLADQLDRPSGGSAITGIAIMAHITQPHSRRRQHACRVCHRSVGCARCCLMLLKAIGLV